MFTQIHVNWQKTDLDKNITDKFFHEGPQIIVFDSFALREDLVILSQWLYADSIRF